ncbi:MAG: hemolysin III family protein [Chloroflexi bacterium]|nr:hemolysin III family protein [Chloroflexota bacterium]
MHPDSGTTTTIDTPAATTGERKPLLRGWLHAGAAVGALVATVAFGIATYGDLPRLLSFLVFGLSMLELYGVSAAYHIGRWPARARKALRALDHANIFVFIAGTYTPICVNVLSGWWRVGVMATVWGLALVGVAGAVLTLRLPRWVVSGLYVGLGWVALVSLPELLRIWAWQPIALMATGGILYTIGAIIYALRRPNPLPGIFGFHEVFHLFVVAGSAVFVAAIWLWVLPFPRA